MQYPAGQNPRKEYECREHDMTLTVTREQDELKSQPDTLHVVDGMGNRASIFTLKRNVPDDIEPVYRVACGHTSEDTTDIDRAVEIACSLIHAVKQRDRAFRGKQAELNKYFDNLIQAEPPYESIDDSPYAQFDVQA